MSDEQTINIDGKDYKSADLTDAQKALCLQVLNLDKKLSEIKFQTDQTQGARNYFMAKLNIALEQGANDKAASE